MNRSNIFVAFAVLAVSVLFILTFQQALVQAQKKSTTARETVKPADLSKSEDMYKVEKRPFKVEISAKGELEPEDAAEIYYRPEPMANFNADLAPLIIQKVVEHGTEVKKGDVLIAFDTRKIDQVIAELRAEKKLMEANLKLTEDELPLAEKSAPVELATAERAKRRADEDRKYFLEVARAQSEKAAHVMVKQAGFYLEYAREELRQLEKMYKSKDLTEETEQIILKRQRNYVELYQYYFKDAQIDRDYLLKVVLPRKEKDVAENVLQKELSLDKARATLGPALVQKRQQLAKMIHDRDRLDDRLKKLDRDRGGMTITAPLDGIVYYGRLHRGQWTAADTMAGKLARGSIAAADDTLMTIVKPRPLFVRLNIDEKDRHLVKPGIEGTVRTTFEPELRLKARVRKISSVPTAPGKFEALVNVDLASHAALMPGMACAVKFIPYAKKDAVVVPAGSVTEDDDRHFVTVVRPGGGKQKREVTTGRTANSETEILAGLRAGEQILKAFPAK